MLLDRLPARRVSVTLLHILCHIYQLLPRFQVFLSSQRRRRNFNLFVILAISDILLVLLIDLYLYSILPFLLLEEVKFVSKYNNLNTVFVRKVRRLKILNSFSKSLGLIAPDSLEFAGSNNA